MLDRSGMWNNTQESTQKSINSICWDLSTVHNDNAGKVMNTATLFGDFKAKPGKTPQIFSLGWGVEGKVKTNTKKKPQTNSIPNDHHNMAEMVSHWQWPVPGCQEKRNCHRNFLVKPIYNLLSKDGAMKIRFRSGRFSQLGLADRKADSGISPKVPMHEKTEMKAVAWWCLLIWADCNDWKFRSGIC